MITMNGCKSSMTSWSLVTTDITRFWVSFPVVLYLAFTAAGFISVCWGFFLFFSAAQLDSGQKLLLSSFDRIFADWSLGSSFGKFYICDEAAFVSLTKENFMYWAFDGVVTDPALDKTDPISTKCVGVPCTIYFSPTMLWL